MRPICTVLAFWGSKLGADGDIYNKTTMGIQSGLLQDLVVAYNNEVTVLVENGGAVDLVLYINSSKRGLAVGASHLASMVFGLGGDFVGTTREQYTVDTPQMCEALGL